MKNNIYFFLLLLLGLPLYLQANSSESKEFRADEYILDHVVDSYGWHITTIKEKDIAIPLPIIIVEKGKFYCFLSSKFHHGNNAYKGFALGFTEETKGKIIKLQGDEENYTGFLEIDKPYTWKSIVIDLSITKNVCAVFISIALIGLIFISVAKKYKRNPNSAPKGFQGIIEVVILFIRDEVAIPLIGHKYHKFLPYLLTLFFFILINNLMGLLPIFPGGANVTGNIAVTMVLALFTFFVFTFSANKNYWKHIFNPPGIPWWLKFPLPLLTIIEMVGLFTKPFVLMIRLFANIMAGHIIILSFLGLIFIFGAMTPAIGYFVSPISILIYVFMGLLELLVAFIQAFVFTMLTALYIGMAIEEHT